MERHGERRLGLCVTPCPPWLRAICPLTASATNATTQHIFFGGIERAHPAHDAFFLDPHIEEVALHDPLDGVRGIWAKTPLDSTFHAIFT